MAGQGDSTGRERPGRVRGLEQAFTYQARLEPTIYFPLCTFV